MNRKESITHSLHLSKASFLYDMYFEEYWVERGMPGSCRCPPNKNKEGKIIGHDCFVPVPENNKKEQVKEKRKKANPKTSRKHKNKKEAVDVKGRRRFGQMNVNEPDDGWPLGPGDLHELFRLSSEVAACLTEALSANFDFGTSDMITQHH